MWTIKRKLVFIISLMSFLTCMHFIIEYKKLWIITPIILSVLYMFLAVPKWADADEIENEIS